MLPALLTPVLWLVLLEHNFQRGRSTNNKNLHRRVMLASSKKHHCLPPQRQRRHVSSIFCQEADTQIDGHPASAPRHAPAPATSPPPGRIPKDAQCWGAGGWPPQGLWAPTRALWPPPGPCPPPPGLCPPPGGSRDAAASAGSGRRAPAWVSAVQLLTAIPALANSLHVRGCSRSLKACVS